MIGQCPFIHKDLSTLVALVLDALMFGRDVDPQILPVYEGGWAALTLVLLNLQNW